MEPILIIIITFILISICTIFILYPKPTKKPATHGFGSYPFLGSLPNLLRHRHHFLDWTTAILSACPANTAVFYRTGKLHRIFTANPQIIEHILKSNFENYPKGTRQITFLEDFLGNGIFNADGETWKIQRKTASYEFNTKSLRLFVMKNISTELQTRLIPVLEKAAKTNRVLDFQDIMERFTFDSICNVAFNVDPGCLVGDGISTVGWEFMHAFEDAATLSLGRFFYPIQRFYKFKKFFNLGSERKLAKAISTVHGYGNKIIRTRLDDENGDERKEEDLLSRFIVSSSKNENIITTKSELFLRDIIISFILAGRDTTSSAISWFFWLLSTRKDVEERILKELENIRAQNGKSIGEVYSFDELREMHYLHASISESMRLYPPVPLNTKACKEDDILPDGTFIGKNWFITYHAYAMGRMESVWGEDCCEYKPERWIDENGKCKQESSFKYPIFHGGPRTCLGKDMAYIQMKSIAASVLERFAMDVVMEKGKSPEHLFSLTLRMKGGLPVRIKDRSI